MQTDSLILMQTLLRFKTSLKRVFNLAVFRDAGKIFFANAFATAISYIGVILVQRLLPYADLGGLAIFNNFVALTTGIILGALNTVFVRYVSRYLTVNIGYAKYFTRLAIKIQCIFAFILATSLIFFPTKISVLLYGKPDLAIYMQLAAAGIIFGILNSYFYTLFQATQKFSQYSLLIILQAIFSTGVVVILAVSGHLTALSSVITNLLIMAILTIFAWLLYQRLPISKAKAEKPPANILRDIFQYGKWILVLSISSFIFLKLDVFMLGRMTSLENVSQYAFANSIYLAYITLLNAMNTILFPRMSILKTESEFQPAAQKVLRYSFITALLLIPTYFLISPMIHLIFGNKFDPAMPILIVMLVGFTFSVVLNPYVNFLMVLGAEKFMATLALSAFILNFIGNLIFIPIFGSLGAVYVTTLTIILTNTIQAFRVYRLTTIRYKIV